MRIKNIAFVGIPVTDVRRAREFYEKVLGLAVSDEMEVENFDEAIKRLKNQGVPFAAEPFETPCCHMAVVHDPDGNKLMIHKLKPENQKGVCK